MKKYRGFSKIGVAVCIVAAVALVGAATWLVIDGKNKATNYDEYDLYALIGPDEHNGNIGDHLKKDEDATYEGEPLYIFEYADFQCPGCASLNPRVNQVVDEMDGKLVVVQRNYIVDGHPNARAAASAAEAAGLQGYWKEYANKLFSSQSEWGYLTGSKRTEAFENYFTEVSEGKGDLTKFREDIASDVVSKKISFDMGIGKRIDVSGTPAFYVEGQFIPWASKEGGSVTINEKTISWDSSLSGSEFVDILEKIVEAKFQ